MTGVERYLILVKGGPPSNYSSWSPDVPGCVATGATIDECVQGMARRSPAISRSCAGTEKRSPEPSGPGVYVERAAG